MDIKANWGIFFFFFFTNLDQQKHCYCFVTVLNYWLLPLIDGQSFFSLFATGLLLDQKTKCSIFWYFCVGHVFKTRKLRPRFLHSKHRRREREKKKLKALGGLRPIPCQSRGFSFLFFLFSCCRSFRRGSCENNR